MSVGKSRVLIISSFQRMFTKSTLAGAAKIYSCHPFYSDIRERAAAKKSRK